MNIVEAVAGLEQPVELHLARLLLLLDTFAQDARNPSIEGLTKLAKLDFLLRYPVMLERALLASANRPARSPLKNKSGTALNPRWCVTALALGITATGNS